MKRFPFHLLVKLYVQDYFLKRASSGRATCFALNLIRNVVELFLKIYHVMVLA
jgi:hypothetical protein